MESGFSVCLPTSKIERLVKEELEKNKNWEVIDILYQTYPNHIEAKIIGSFRNDSTVHFCKVITSSRT